MTDPNARTLKVSAADLTDIKCDQCGDLRFEPVFLLKKVSALISPTGKEETAPIPTFACYACGHINVKLLPMEMRPQTPEAQKIVASTLPELTPITKE